MSKLEKIEKAEFHEEKIICPNCAEEYTDTCEECGDLFFKDELIFDGEKYICKWCKGDL